MSPPPARRLGALVLALTVIALGARLVGIGQMLPHRTEADIYLVPQAHAFRYDMVTDSTRAGPISKYPHLLARVLASIPPEPIPELERPDPDDDRAVRAYLDAHLDAAGSDYRHARQMIAILSALVVPFTYLLARRVLAPGPALVAAALIAASLLHTSFSQQARPHGALATFMTATLWTACMLQREGTWRWLVLTTLVACAALGCLHNGAAVLPAALVAFLARRGGTARVGHATLLVPVAALALTVWLFYPFLFAGGGFGGLSTEGEVIAQGGHRVETSWFNWKGFAEIHTHLGGYDPALYALGVAGLVLLAARPRGRPGRGGALLVIGAFALPYTTALGLLWFTPERYLIPLLPVLAIGAAALLDALARGLARGRPRLAAGLLVLGAALALWPSARASARLVWLRSRPDTLTLAARWLADHVPREGTRIVATPGVALPFFYSRTGLAVSRTYMRFWRTPWHLYQELLERKDTRGLAWQFYPFALRPEDAQGGRDTLPRTPADVRSILRQADADYAVVVRSGYRDDPIRASLAALGERVAGFAPADEAGRVRGGAGFQVGEDMRGFVLGATEWGPPVEIWRLRPLPR